jgi:required for meiotic nuclear division protein 1
MAADQLFEGQRRLRAHAWFLGERIDVRALEGGKLLASVPLTVSAGAHGCATLFRYGAVVLFQMDAVEEARFLADLAPLVGGRFTSPKTEEAEIVIEPSEDDRIDAFGTIRLQNVELARLLIVAHALAKSAVLSHFEERIAEVFERIEPQAEELRRSGKTLASGPGLLREIGDVLLVQTRTVARVEITEKPELTWERPELDRLYVKLAAEHELRARDLSLTRKLELVTETTRTLLELLHNRSSLRVEWYIVLLIVAEILLTLYDRLMG